MWIFIIFAITVIAIVALGVYLSKNDDTCLKDATDYAVTELYMTGKIDVDTYLYYSMRSSEGRKLLTNNERFSKFRKRELYDDNSLSAKIDRDVNKK